jgi:hypothetical protein
MPTIAPDRPETDVGPGFRGFVDLAEAVGLAAEVRQSRTASESSPPLGGVRTTRPRNRT